MLAANCRPKMDVAIRTSGAPDALRRSAGTGINSVGADLPMSNVIMMDQLIDETFLESKVEESSNLFVSRY